MKTIKKVLSLIVCMALIACMAITGMPAVSAEDTATTYPLEFARLNGTEWPIVGPGLNGVISGSGDYDVMNFDRYFNFTSGIAAGVYCGATVNRGDTNLSYYRDGISKVDFSGADVFTFVLNIEDNGAWEIYKDYLKIILKSDATEYPIPAADIAEAVKDYVPGTTQKIKINLNNMDKSLLTAINNIWVGVEEGAAESELNLHVKISAMKAEVLPTSVLFAELIWDWPMVNPGLTGAISGSADTDLATLNRYLNFTTDIETDVKSSVSVVRSAANKAGADLSLCDYFALNFWVEDNGAWDIYKDYIKLSVNGQELPAEATAKALVNVVPGVESRIYLDLSSIDKSALTAANTFSISVADTNQTSDIHLHIKAKNLYGEIAYDDVMIGDDEADEALSGLGVNTEQAKVGAKSYKKTSFNGGNFAYGGFWGGSKFAAKDASKVTNGGRSGAVRFWVYVDSAERLETINNLTNSYLYLGSSTHPDGANTGDWWYIWGGWAKQITEIGWNEVILKMGSNSVIGSANVDFTNVESIWLKCSADGLTLWFDDFKFSYDTAPTPANEDVMIIDDEANENFPSAGGGYVTNAAKIGDFSYKTHIFDGGHSFINGFYGRACMASKDISKVTNNGKTGALRFWVYITDAEILNTLKANASNTLVYLGTNSTGDSSGVPESVNWSGYGGWASQLTKVGWNEIILPIASFGRGADFSNINSIWIRLLNFSQDIHYYIDDFKVSEDINPTVESFEDVTLIDDENGEDSAWTDVVDYRVKVGSHSLESTTLDREGWITFAGFYGQDPLAAKDISIATNNGKMGALRFWLYVEDISMIDVVKELEANGTLSYIKLGTAKSPDGSYFVWNKWINQITKSGWNEIILPFANCYIETGVAPDTTAIDTIYMKFGTGTPSMNLYLDDIKVSEDIAPTPIEGDANGDGVLNVLDLITVKKALANGEDSYTADDLALVRKLLVNKW